MIATRTHGHGHVSTHVRWLYDLIRVANAAAAVFDGFLFGVPSTRAVSPIAERGFLAGYLLLEIWSGRREGRANTQSSRRTYHLVASLGGVSELQGFSDRLLS